MCVKVMYMCVKNVRMTQSVMKKGAGRMTVTDSLTLCNEHCETFLMETIRRIGIC
jgi:hypothetical protein